MESQEPREVSGLTTSLILSYLEREEGEAAVQRALELAGLEGREAELRDEDRWFADQRRVDLFEAAAEVTGDAEVARRVGETAIEFNVGQALKLALRALGSPRLVYTNIVRANSKFNAVYEMSVLDIADGRATLRNVPRQKGRHFPCDCHYNVGILSCVPLIFGLPAAKVSHPVCIGKGAEECIFEIEWHQSRSPIRWTLAGLATLGATAVAAPAALPFAAAGASVMAVVAISRVVQLRRGRMRALEERVEEEAMAAERMMNSLKDIVSALHLDEVLEKITENAQAAVGGAEYALLVREEGRLRCRSSSDLPNAFVELIERWADRNAGELDDMVTVEDLASSRELAPLAAHDRLPLRSLTAMPLSSREQPLGVLVALATGPRGFLPRDVVQLQAYAAQAAIALTNAKLFHAQQELAIQDALTGLYNHRHFHETLERELDRCRRYGDELGVVSFDLNDFKLVNDRQGHAEGDDVLRSVASALRGCCRISDLAFRVGGDEFALVLPNTGSDDVELIAERAAAAIRRADGRASVSWGTASWPQAGPTKDAVIARADEAMYEMKRQGGAIRSSRSERDTGGDPGHRERLASANRLALQLAPMLDVRQIAEATVQELVDSLGLHLAVVLRLEGERLRALAADGPLLERLPGVEDWDQPADSGVNGRALRGGEAVLVDDTGDDPAFLGAGSDHGTASELSTPIRVGGELWGILNLEHSSRDGFEFDDLLFADTAAAAIGAAVHRAKLHGELESSLLRTLAVLDTALEAKDPYTAAHARSVAGYVESVSRRLGLSEEQRRNLSYAALLHDIGKIGIRSEVLLKPGPLSDAEYEEVKQHTLIGARMLERMPFFREVHPLVRYSHERWDGGGYPEGLREDEIPLGARIIAVCDAYEAMSSDRPYRKALAPEAVRAELESHAGTQFDPLAVEALLAVLDQGVDSGPVPPTTVGTA